MKARVKPEPPQKLPPPCAICGKPVDQKYKPFCSARCAKVDLHRWLNNTYSIAGSPPQEDPASDQD